MTCNAGEDNWWSQETAQNDENILSFFHQPYVTLCTSSESSKIIITDKMKITEPAYKIPLTWHNDDNGPNVKTVDMFAIHFVSDSRYVTSTKFFQFIDLKGNA